MSTRFSSRRKFLGAVFVVSIAALALPSTATADPLPVDGVYGSCVPIPVTTPGVTTLGQHVPAISHVELCAFTGFWTDIRLPRLTQYSGCGSPCFDIRTDARPAQLGFDGVIVLMRWWEDGIEKYPIPLTETPSYNPDWVGPDDTCLIAVGTPTPPC